MSVPQSKLRLQTHPDPKTHLRIHSCYGTDRCRKSTLINKILGPGHQQAMVGYSLDSCTKEVQAFECFNSEGRRIILIDSPGFDGTNVSDLGVLQSIADWLKQSYEEGKLLSGLLFLHRISDDRMTGSPSRVLEIFKNICGEEAFRNVVLVTFLFMLASREKVNCSRMTGIGNLWWLLERARRAL